MGKGDLFREQELQEHLRFVAAGIDLLGADHGAEVGHAPGVDVKHGGDGHIDVRGVQGELGFVDANARHETVSVQHDLTVAVENALGQTGGPGGVEGRCHGVFIQIGEIIMITGPGEQVFVFSRQRKAGLRSFAVGQQNEFLDRLDLVPDGFQHGEEFRKNQDDIVFGVIDGVEQLFRRQSDVDRVQDSAHHGNGKETFQVAVAVPVHHGHGLAGFDAGRGQHVGQLVDALIEVAVSVAHLVPIDDFLVWRILKRCPEDVFDEQGISIGRRGFFNQSGWHGTSLCGFAFKMIAELSSNADPGCDPGIRTKAAGMDEKGLRGMHGNRVK